MYYRDDGRTAGSGGDRVYIYVGSISDRSRGVAGKGTAAPLTSLTNTFLLLQLRLSLSRYTPLSLIYTSTAFIAYKNKTLRSLLNGESLSYFIPRTRSRPDDDALLFEVAPRRGDATTSTLAIIIFIGSTRYYIPVYSTLRTIIQWKNKLLHLDSFRLFYLIHYQLYISVYIIFSLEPQQRRLSILPLSLLLCHLFYTLRYLYILSSAVFFRPIFQACVYPYTCVSVLQCVGPVSSLYIYRAVNSLAYIPHTYRREGEKERESENCHRFSSFFFAAYTIRPAKRE